MSGVKQEVIEGVGAKIAEWGKKQLGNMGKPLEIMDVVNPTALQRVAGGAVMGGSVGAGINITTGIAGSVLSPITGGVITDSGDGIVNANSFGVGSVINSAMKGAAAGALLFGAGFKSGVGGLEMRSGLRAFSDVVGDAGAKLGLGVSRGGGAGAAAVEGRLGTKTIKDSFMNSARFVDKGDDLAENLAGHRARDIQSMSRKHRIATNRLKSEEGVLREYDELANTSTQKPEPTLNMERWGEVEPDGTYKFQSHKSLKQKQALANQENIDYKGGNYGVGGYGQGVDSNAKSAFEAKYEQSKSVIRDEMKAYNEQLNLYERNQVRLTKLGEKKDRINLERTQGQIDQNDISKLSRNEDFLKFGTLKAEAKATKATKVESNQSVNKIDPQTQTSVNSVGTQESIKLEANKAVSPSAVEAPVSPAANQSVKSPGYFSKKWESAKNDPAKAAGASLIGGGLAMSMYQTNALGITIPSNRGYR